MESLSNIKCEDIEIKSETNHSDVRLQNLKHESVDCPHTSLLTNYANVKEEIKDICEDTAIETRSDIKFEYVEIKSQEDDSDSSIQNLKDEPVDCTDECQPEYVKTTSNSTLKRKANKYDSKDKHRGLKHRVFFEKKMYKCDVCDYESDRKRNLTRHQLRHIDVPEDQMYKCDVCDYKAALKSTFKHHQLRHKDIPEEQMFKCDSCDYKTVYKPYFMQHQFRRHKNIPEEQMFKCDLCNYITIYKRYFMQHQLRHKDIPVDQLYKCNLCDYKTISKSYLNRHHITH